MKKTLQCIETESAPQAIGPYSQAVRAGGLLFISGQLPLDPTTKKLAGETIQLQTRQVLKNIEAILKTCGLTFARVVKVDVFMKDLQEFQEMNTIYAEAFSYPVKPARATVQVARLPMDVKIEIACTALLED